MNRTAVAVGLLLAASPLAAGEPPDLRRAIERGLRRADAGATRYLENRTCFACHHQLAVPVLAAARDRGFAVSRWTLWAQTEHTREAFRPDLERVRKGQGIPGTTTMAAYALFVLEAGGQPPDETTAGLVEYLVKRQAADGSWPAAADRPPSEGSRFTTAALALRALKFYGLNDDATSADQKARIQQSWDRGKAWLLQHEPKTTEDRAFHLRALIEAEADRAVISKARSALADVQRPDGGWSQLPELESDAYATGIVLTALHRAGLPPTAPAYRRGVEYLLRTQKDDGSWLVTTRSRAVQIFFDNGDPGGKSQFISMAATNWALLALLTTIDRVS